jgi:hypothetical protein
MDVQGDHSRAVLMAARKNTEKRAASAARQLLYHQRLSEWISQKSAENEAILEGYLVGSGEDRAVLVGGYVLERAGEEQGSPIEVSGPLVGPDYEQLALLEEVC